MFEFLKYSRALINNSLQARGALQYPLRRVKDNTVLYLHRTWFLILSEEDR